MRSLLFASVLLLPTIALAQATPQDIQQAMGAQLTQQLGELVQARAQMLADQREIAGLKAQLAAAKKRGASKPAPVVSPP